MSSIALFMLLQSAAASCGQLPELKEAGPAKQDMVLKWNAVALQAIRVEKTTPPMAARNLAIMHLAIFDSVNAVHRKYESYHVDLAAPDASPEAAAAAAAHTALIALFPKGKRAFDDIYLQCVAEVHDSDARARGMELGRRIAEKLLTARAEDGSKQPGTYQPKQGPGFWQPTVPEFRAALYPDWGNLTPFAIRKGTQYRPAGPPSLDSPAYADAFREVKLLGAKDSSVRTKEQTDIALFWADNAGTSTPPGHWNIIAQDLARQRGTTLLENARLFALLNLGLADASVLCWVFKFTYEVWRPVTGIRLAHEDDNPQTDADPNWTPLLPTPPFPAYTSGHSTFSAAGATVLANFFGTDKLRFSTTSEGLPGVTRTFDSIWAAAEEAGMSRIYGGIHWQFDNVDGLATGKTLGEYVARNYLRVRTREPMLLFKDGR